VLAIRPRGTLWEARQGQSLGSFSKLQTRRREANGAGTDISNVSSSGVVSPRQQDGVPGKSDVLGGSSVLVGLHQ
jgi:hypothetical protein